jgi:DNA (cytosine-5)-methyltransferase 1
MTTLLKLGALFAGIGGLDYGFHKSGSSVVFNSEIDEPARLVLAEQFPESLLLGDIKEIKRIPDIDILTGGFPCQDISIAGTRAGLAGERSGLVNQVFRLISGAKKPDLVILENVLNLISLHQGAALRSILNDFENLGYRWAYRVVDTRGFGLPQRRLRVVLVASRGPLDPSQILFQDQVDSQIDDSVSTLDVADGFGFYWTEGKRGIGWAADSVPTIKGGSSLGIPSPPAVFNVKEMTAGTITIEDAERLQGFPSGWTDVPGVGRIGNRWKMVGNAVSVPVSIWLHERISNYSETQLTLEEAPLSIKGGMPRAACGGPRQVGKRVLISSMVYQSKPTPILEFLEDPLKPMSEKALKGYLSRVREGNKIFPPGFVEALENQLASY